MLTYKEFNSFLDIIKETQETEAAFSKALEPFNDSWCNFNFTPCDKLIDWLESAVGDGAKWVSWFVYECKWGKKPMEYSLEKGGELHLMKTRKQLWEAINA